MKLVASLSRVTARFGMAASAHHRHTEGRKGVAERSGFAGAEHDAHLRKGESQGAEELGEVTVLKRKARLKLPSGRTQTRHAHGELGSPTNALEMEQMGGQCGRLTPPIGESEQNADSNPTESGLMGTLRGIETPVEILLGPRKMKFPVSLPIIGLLIDHKPLGTGGDERDVVGGLHGGHLERKTRDLPVQSLDAALEILSRDEFGMFPRHEQDVTESLSGKMPCLGRNLLDLKGDTEDRLVFTRESAVGAGVHTLVGEIERCKQTHRASEVASGQCRGTTRHLLERPIAAGLQQSTKGRKLRRRRSKGAVEDLRKTHRGSV